MVVLVICKNEEHPLECSKHYKSIFQTLNARMNMIQSKMKELEWSQHFPHNKSIVIFPDAHGQLTSQSLVQSCQISNSF